MAKDQHYRANDGIVAAGFGLSEGKTYTVEQIGAMHKRHLERLARRKAEREIRDAAGAPMKDKKTNKVLEAKPEPVKGSPAKLGQPLVEAWVQAGKLTPVDGPDAA